MQGILRSFLSDPLSFTLLVHKKVRRSASGDSSSADGKEEDESASESYSFDLTLKPPNPSDKERVAATVALIKTAPTIDLASSPLSAQLLLLSVNESNLFESMLAYVRHCFLPYSRAWMGGSAGEADKPETDLGEAAGRQQ